MSNDNAFALEELFERGELAEFYRLRIVDDPWQLCLEVREDEALTLIDKMNRMNLPLLNREAFIRPRESMFGWGCGAIAADGDGSPPNWRRLLITLPRGTSMLDTRCERITSPDSLGHSDRIAQTLAIIFFCLECSEHPRRGEPSQRILVQTYTPAKEEQAPLGGYGLSVRLDLRSTEILKSFENEKRASLERKVAKTIRTTYARLCGYPENHLTSECDAEILPDGRVMMKTSGNCACLTPDGFWMPRHNPVQTLHPHNIDGPVQQLSLLAGVARLWDGLDSPQNDSH